MQRLTIYEMSNSSCTYLSFEERRDKHKVLGVHEELIEEDLLLCVGPHVEVFAVLVVGHGVLDVAVIVVEA